MEKFLYQGIHQNVYSVTNTDALMTTIVHSYTMCPCSPCMGVLHGDDEYI